MERMNGMGEYTPSVQAQAVMFLFLGVATFLMTGHTGIKRRGWDGLFKDPVRAALWAVAAVAAIIALTAVFMLGLSTGTAGPEQALPQNPQAWVGSIGLNALFMLLLSTPVLAVMRLRKETASTAGVHTRGLGSAVAVGLALSVLMFMCLAVLGRIEGRELGLALSPALLTGLLYLVMVSLYEEFVFRGYFQTRLMAVMGTTTGWVTASIVFALWHIPQRMATWGLPPAEAVVSSLQLIPLSLLLGYAYVRTENLAAPVILHTFGNWLLTLWAMG